MQRDTPKAVSVDEQGQPDGWALGAGFFGEFDGGGATRLIVAVPPAWLRRVHLELVGVLEPPLSVLYRQVVDRVSPRPEGTPPRGDRCREKACRCHAPDVGRRQRVPS